MKTRKRRQDPDAEYNFWQPATDMMSALVYVLLLIIALLGLYLLSDYTGLEEPSSSSEEAASSGWHDDDYGGWHDGGADEGPVSDALQRFRPCDMLQRRAIGKCPPLNIAHRGRKRHRLQRVAAIEGLCAYRGERFRQPYGRQTVTRHERFVRDFGNAVRHCGILYVIAIFVRAIAQSRQRRWQRRLCQRLAALESILTD